MLVLSATIVHIYRVEDVSSYNKVSGTMDFLYEFQGEANSLIKKIMMVPHRGKIYSVIITVAKYADRAMLMTGDIFSVQDELPAPVEKAPVVEEVAKEEKVVKSDKAGKKAKS